LLLSETDRVRKAHAPEVSPLLLLGEILLQPFPVPSGESLPLLFRNLPDHATSPF
jgi:hypothetical protein